MSDLYRPNWLLITFDQWRGDWLHQPWLDLPVLRGLSRQGWDLRRCYTSCPQCIPARVSWLTGQTPKSLRLTKNRPYSVAPDAPSFVRELRDAGNYRTVLVGKTHWTPQNKPGDLRDNLPLLRALGFDHAREIAGQRAMQRMESELTDRWREAGVLEQYREDLQDRYASRRAHCVRPSVLPDALYPDLWLTGVATEELMSLSDERPWFLWVSFPGPHEPFDVPASWCRTRSIPPPVPRPQDPEQLRRLAPPDSVLAGKLNRWPDGLPPEALEALRQDYANHLELLDQQVGELLKVLEQRGDAANTAVTVCSDHGELLGDWGLLLKGCFLEGAIRSLFLHRPGGGRTGLRRLWRADRRPYGLTESLWAAHHAVIRPEDGSFGHHLRQMRKEVTIAFADEEITLQ